MIKLFLGIIAIAEVSRFIVDIITKLNEGRILKQTLEEQKKARAINADNLELTKSYKDRVEAFNDAVSKLGLNQKALHDMSMNLDKRMKVLEN